MAHFADGPLDSLASYMYASGRQVFANRHLSYVFLSEMFADGRSDSANGTQVFANMYHIVPLPERDAG